MCICCLMCFSFFFFNDTATTEIYTLSLHDALPICCAPTTGRRGSSRPPGTRTPPGPSPARCCRSEEHTSELQSHSDLVCRLLLEKKKKKSINISKKTKKTNKNVPKK